jgi:hypothetical protein
MEQTLAGLAPLRGAAARGRLALAYCFPPIPQKSGMDGARSHCMEQTLAGLAPLRGAAARGRLALAYCFPPIPQKSGMDGARSFMRCEMEIGGGADEFW